MVGRAAVVTVLAGLATSGVFAQLPAAQPATAGNAEAGRRAYTEFACFYCHGTVGQGSLPAVGPRIARVQRSLESFTAYVRRPTGRMSAYSEALISDAALADIYAYLRSVAEPAVEPPELLRLLRQR